MKIFQHIAFALLLTECIVVLGLRLRSLLPLIRENEVRNNIGSTIKNVAEKEGWILSDLTMKKFDHDSVTVTLRPHFRTARGSRCFDLDLHTERALPCQK